MSHPFRFCKLVDRTSAKGYWESGFEGLREDSVACSSKDKLHQCWTRQNQCKENVDANLVAWKPILFIFA